MTSVEIEVAIADFDKSWAWKDSELFHSQLNAQRSSYRASLEVAYQLALLNEPIGGVLNNRVPQIRVMCEPGEWPLQVQVQERR
jgi:hypothetical protein